MDMGLSVEDFVVRLETKVDDIATDVKDLGISLARHAAVLDAHVKLEDALEARHLEHRSSIDASISKLREEMKPITRSQYMFAGVGKAVALLATFSSIGFGIIELIHFLK